MNLAPQGEPTVIPQQTFADWLEQMWREKYTGPVLVHFGQGRPNAFQKVERAISLDKTRL